MDENERKKEQKKNNKIPNVLHKDTNKCNNLIT